MSETPQTIYLKDYQPPHYLIPTVDLHFDLQEESTMVTAKLQVRRNPDSSANTSELFLNGKKLELVSIKRDGETLQDSQYTVTSSGLTLKDCPDNFLLETQVKLKPQNNKAFSGLYKTKTVFCTQMEAQGFRRTTFFMDRPDVLSKYRTTLVADPKKYPVLLSNGNFISEKQLDNGRLEVVWEDPFPKPCYLFALVAGDLDWIEDSFMTRSNKKVALKIYVDKGKKDRARFAMDSLKQSMKWDEDTYRLEYDLDIYNIVAVDDFNMGAMENKGLNIFNSKYVLASAETATDDEYQAIQRVIGHEYFHNWTGNRVTCRDWFQLSLKEGLTVFRDQEFSSDMNSRPVKRIEDVSALRSRQFPEDAGPMAHPVRPSSYIAIDNFYTVTVYEKGAEVIRMLHTLLGADMFKKGVTTYFELFDGQAVTTDDWIHAMEKVSKRDLSTFKLWYDQAGTPEVSVSTSFSPENQTFEIELEQTTKDPITGKEHQPFHIPFKVGLVSAAGSPLDFTYQDDQKSVQNAILELDKKKQNFVLKNVNTPPVLSMNREFSAPVQLNFEQSDQDLYLLMTKDPDSFNRWESAQKLYRQTLIQFYNMILAGESPQLPAELKKAFSDLILKGEEDPALTARIMELPQTHYLAQFLDEIDPQVLYEAYQTFYTQMSEHVNEDALALYTRLEEKNLGQSAKDVALRMFKNHLMFYLFKNNEKQGAPLFMQQFEQARNMTDSLAALGRLSHVGGAEFSQAMKKFRDRWHEDLLVMNKLFLVTANSKADNAFENIQKQYNSPDFDKTNPNNVFALLYSFAQNNWPRFHEPSGAVYDWFADATIDVDSRNPQVASRLGSCFNNWKQMAPNYGEGMKKALEKIRDSKPSDNLYEIVSKALL